MSDDTFVVDGATELVPTVGPDQVLVVDNRGPEPTITITDHGGMTPLSDTVVR